MTLRVAIPKGRLQPGVMSWLAQPAARAVFGDIAFAHYRSYRGVSSRPGVQASLIKPRAIPQLVALDLFDVGFCGLDLLLEAEAGCAPVLDLKLNHVRLEVGVPSSKSDILSNPPSRPLIIATEYPNLAEKWAFDRGVACIVVQTFGGTEAYVPEIADVVLDCVETGATLQANGLIPVEPLMSSSTHLVCSRRSVNDPEIRQLLRALALEEG